MKNRIILTIAFAVLVITFDSYGMQLPTSNTQLAVRIQPDGKTLVLSLRKDSSTGDALIVSRFYGDGTLDETFGADGKMSLLQIGSSIIAETFDLQKDGSIIINYATVDQVDDNMFGFRKGTKHKHIIRVNSDGTLAKEIKKM